MFLLFAGCVSTSTVRLAGVEDGPFVRPHRVEVFLSEEEIPADYERVAMIFAEGDRDFTNEEDLVEAMKEEAAELGANGIVLGELGFAPGPWGLIDWILEEQIEYGHFHRDLWSRRGEVLAVRIYWN